jgi:hypothetical protein
VRRRRGEPPDSLELLLDTLCNTFGGVLFIAMLVAVLLQIGGESTPAETAQSVSAATLAELNDTLAVLRDEVDALEATLGGQEALADRTSTEDLDALIRRREAATAAASRLASARDHSLVDLGRREQRVREIGESLEALESRLAEARGRRDEARERLAEARTSRSRTIHAPVVHRSFKNSIALVVRYERMYVWHRYDSLGNRLGPDLDEVVIVEDTSGGLLTAPNPRAGIPISENPTLKEAVARRLAAFPPDRYDLQIVVRPDSFGSFHTLRSALAEIGYECDILLADRGRIVDRGGADRGVQ